MYQPTTSWLPKFLMRNVFILFWGTLVYDDFSLAAFNNVWLLKIWVGLDMGFWVHLTWSSLSFLVVSSNLGNFQPLSSNILSTPSFSGTGARAVWVHGGLRIANENCWEWGLGKWTDKSHGAWGSLLNITGPGLCNTCTFLHCWDAWLSSISSRGLLRPWEPAEVVTSEWAYGHSSGISTQEAVRSLPLIIMLFRASWCRMKTCQFSSFPFGFYSHLKL